jgi:hypothetical protein
MYELITLIILFLIAWFFWSGTRSKEIACSAGKTYCTEQGVQFLDHTVEQKRLRLTKDTRNNPVWYRSYQFEFATNGEFRYQGMIEMYGHHLKSIKMDPYPESSE